jgi:hypothetical protein
VLDSLSWRFEDTWRGELVPSCYSHRDTKPFLRTSPSIIILAALALAHGYLVDRQRSSRHWSLKESAGAFTVVEIEATKRAILADVDYGLFRISNDSVQRMLRDMRRPKTAITHSNAMRGGAKRGRSRTLEIEMKGHAVWKFGELTPEPSP